VGWYNIEVDYRRRVDIFINNKFVFSAGCVIASAYLRCRFNYNMAERGNKAARLAPRGWPRDLQFVEKDTYEAS
jgi:hypothetical protein